MSISYCVKHPVALEFGRLSDLVTSDQLASHRNCMGSFRYALALAAKPFSTNYLRPYRPNHVRFASKRKSSDKISPQLKNPLLPFAGLGLDRTVRIRLKKLFPGGVNPTDAQSTFIPLILRGKKDVCINGQMGSGKCVKFVAGMSNVDLTMVQ